MSVLCLPLHLYGKIYTSGKWIQKPRPCLPFYSFYCLIVSYIYAMDFNNFLPALLSPILLSLSHLNSTVPLFISGLLFLGGSQSSIWPECGWEVIWCKSDHISVAVPQKKMIVLPQQPSVANTPSCVGEAHGTCPSIMKYWCAQSCSGLVQITITIMHSWWQWLGHGQKAPFYLISTPPWCWHSKREAYGSPTDN